MHFPPLALASGDDFEVALVDHISVRVCVCVVCVLCVCVGGGYGGYGWYGWYGVEVPGYEGMIVHPVPRARWPKGAPASAHRRLVCLDVRVCRATDSISRRAKVHLHRHRRNAVWMRVAHPCCRRRRKQQLDRGLNRA